MEGDFFLEIIGNIIVLLYASVIVTICQGGRKCPHIIMVYFARL